MTDEAAQDGEFGPADAGEEIRAVLVRLRDAAGGAPGPDGAAHMLEAVACELTAACGRYDRDTLAAWREAGRQKGLAGDPAGAVHLLGQVAADLAQALGPGDRDTLHAHLELATAIGDGGDPHDAMHRLHELLPLLHGAFGPQDARVQAAQIRVAINTGRAGDVLSAVGQLLQLVPVAEQLLGPQAPLLDEARAGLGRLVPPWRRMAGGAAGLSPVMAVAMVHRLVVWDFDSDQEADAFLSELERATGRKGLAGRLAALPDGVTAAQATAMVLG